MESTSHNYRHCLEFGQLQDVFIAALGNTLVRDYLCLNDALLGVQRHIKGDRMRYDRMR